MQTCVRKHSTEVAVCVVNVFLTFCHWLQLNLCELYGRKKKFVEILFNGTDSTNFLLLPYFKISTTSSHLHGDIIFAQAVAIPEFGRIITGKAKFQLPYFDFFLMFNWGICTRLYYCSLPLSSTYVLYLMC